MLVDIVLINIWVQERQAQVVIMKDIVIINYRKTAEERKNNATN